MSMRVTSGGLSQSIMAGLQANLARLQHTEEQMATGRRINRVSDSPVDAAAAMRLRAEQSANQQVGRNIDDGLNVLGSADTAFKSMSTMLVRIRQLVVSGLSSGTNGPGERAAMATEVDTLKDGLIALANTQYLGRPIFAGTADVTAAYSPSGAYQGNNQEVQRNVSADGSSKLGVTVTGDATFSTLFSDPADVASLGILSRISADLRDPNGTAALSTELGKFDTASATLQTSRSLVGLRYNRLLGLQTAGESRLDAVSANLAMAENIDLPKTIIDMQIQTTSYQAALGAAAKIIQPSLLDFLR